MHGDLHLLRPGGEEGGGRGGEELQLQVRVVLQHQVRGVHQQEDTAHLRPSCPPRPDHEQPQLARLDKVVFITSAIEIRNRVHLHLNQRYDIYILFLESVECNKVFYDTHLVPHNQKVAIFS